LRVREGLSVKGMSGSPLVDEDGRAIGLVTTGGSGDQEYGTISPALSEVLPGWLLRELGLR
jgi:S1-C subfamily serine protease